MSLLTYEGHRDFDLVPSSFPGSTHSIVGPTEPLRMGTPDDRARITQDEKRHGQRKRMNASTLARRLAKLPQYFRIDHDAFCLLDASVPRVYATISDTCEDYNCTQILQMGCLAYSRASWKATWSIPITSCHIGLKGSALLHL